MDDTRETQVQEITKRLRIIFKAVQAHSKFVEKQCGLSSAKLWMLHEIAASPGVRVSRLAAALSIHPSTCSNMLDKLEAMGLISRDRSKTDQRSVHLHTTGAGSDLLARAPKPAQGQLSSALEKLSSPQLSCLESGLSDLIDALNIEDHRASFIPIPGE